MSDFSHTESGKWFSHTPLPLQFPVGIILVFLLAFGADVLLQWIVGLFLAGIMEQDTFFYSAVRQQDTFAQGILQLIKLISFLGIGAGFAGALIFFSTHFFGRSSPQSAPRLASAQLLKKTLLSFRSIATMTFVFLVVTAIYQLLLRVIGNQPPFFLLAALVIAVMYILILAYLLFDYTRTSEQCPQHSRGGRDTTEEE